MSARLIVPRASLITTLEELRSGILNTRRSKLEKVVRREYRKIFGVEPQGLWLDQLLYQIEHVWRMAISSTPVQAKAANAWVSGTTITFTITAQANGNGSVIGFGAAATTVGVTSISQTGATWIKADSTTVQRDTEIWFTLNVSGAGTTITVNLSSAPSAANQIAADFTEWSGLATSAALDQHTTSSGASTTSPVTGSITPTAGRNALIYAVSRNFGADTAPTNSFTLTTSQPTNTGSSYLVAASTSGSYSTGWTSGSAAYSTAIAAFLAPAGGASPTYPELERMVRGVGRGLLMGLAH